MTKKFCDICSKPAADTCDAVTRMKESPLLSGAAKIEVRMTVRFLDHPAGFGGPPDLCHEHRMAACEELKLCMAPVEPEHQPPGKK